MPACSQILPIQEDVPAELHTYRRMKMLTGDLPAPFVAYVAQNDWVNNCFMSAETEYGIHWVVRFCI